MTQPFPPGQAPSPDDPTQPFTPNLEHTQPAQMVPTQPMGPVIYPMPQPTAPATRQPRRRRGGCVWVFGLAVLVALIPVFLVGIGLVIYLVLPPAPLDVLILGMDARQGEGFEARTDSVMLLGINPGGLQVSLLSIPRDIFIEVPEWGLWRINTINRDAELAEPGSGPRLAKEAVGMNFGVGVDRYMRINFDAFVQIIDALGGIDIEVSRLLVDYEYPDGAGGTITVEFQPGWQHMDGARALAYARTRHADDDYQRAARQQQVVTAVLRAALNPVTWPRLPGAIQAFSQGVDTDLSLLDLLVMAPPLVLDGAGGDIDRMVVNRDLILYTENGNAVPNYVLVNPWVAERFD